MLLIWNLSDKFEELYVDLAIRTEFYSAAVKNVLQIFLSMLQIQKNDTNLEPSGQSQGVNFTYVRFTAVNNGIFLVTDYQINRLDGKYTIFTQLLRKKVLILLMSRNCCRYEDVNI